MFIKDNWFEKIRESKILAVNPPVYDFAWFDLWARPVGLLNFLAYLRSRGNRVELIDCLYEGRLRPLSHGRWKVRREERDRPLPLREAPRRYYRFGLSEADFQERLRNIEPPDVIVLTSIMTYWYPGVAESIGHLRAAFPGRPIILGGIYATLCPGHASSLGADQVLPAFAAPRGPALPLDLYQSPGYAVISTSYGCPRRCHYCASAQIHPSFSPRPLAEIINDLEKQLALGPIADLAFYDDALLWDMDNVFYPLCDYLSARHAGLKLHSPNGLAVDKLDDKCCLALKRAGFKTLRLSFEGRDGHTRAASNQKASEELYLRTVESLLAAGFTSDDLETYLLVGLPGQSSYDVEDSIEFVKKAGARPKLCEYSPIPGTRLFQREAEARPLLAQEPLWHNNSVYITYLSGRIEADELQRLKNISRTT